MAQTIESDKLYIKQVFTNWYRIPEYQRPYVWGTDQVTELLDDVSSASQSNPNAEYFLGSMVLKRTKKPEGYEEYDLLDGQQRVTTLFLLTAVVRDLTPASNRQRVDTCRTAIFQEANPDDRVPERLRIVFDIRDQVRDFIDEYVKVEGGTNREDDLAALRANVDSDLSIRNMANTILTIRRYFGEDGPGDLETFFQFLRSQVLMIYVATEELEDAFHLFTVMNSRGVKLRNADILKAENLGKVPLESRRAELAKRWEATEKTFGEDFDNFLSHLRTILVKGKASVNLLKEFHDNIYEPKRYNRTTKTYEELPALLERGEPTFQFVERYKRHYSDLFEQDHFDLTNSFEFYNHIVLMERGFEADLWVPPLLRFYDKFRTARLVPFIKALENKFGADWLLGYTPTSRIENMNAVIQCIDDSASADDVLSSDTLQFENRALRTQLDSPIYGRRGGRYIMLKLDLGYHGHTTKFAPPGTVSIEHILPQNPDAASQWRLDFTDDEREEWKDKVGNLVLISRRKNTSQSNRDYAEKKERYFKNNVELFSNSVRLYQQYPTWQKRDVERNHNEVHSKLCTAFDASVRP